MFLINSRLSLFTEARQGSIWQADFTLRAPLIPKIRGQVVEFLNEGYLVHLGTFTPAHLCRFAVRTLYLHNYEAFLVSVGSIESSLTNLGISSVP